MLIKIKMQIINRLYTIFLGLHVCANIFGAAFHTQLIPGAAYSAAHAAALNSASSAGGGSDRETAVGLLGQNAKLKEELAKSNSEKCWHLGENAKLQKKLAQAKEALALQDQVLTMQNTTIAQLKAKLQAQQNELQRVRNGISAFSCSSCKPILSKL
jgi:uncharacterized coiled-coil protein SlyX